MITTRNNTAHTAMYDTVSYAIGKFAVKYKPCSCKALESVWGGELRAAADLSKVFEICSMGLKYGDRADYYMCWIFWW